MKRKIFLAYIRSGNLFKGRHSFVPVVVANICILFSGYFLWVHLPGFEIIRKRATEVEKDILSDFISLLGIGLAVLAVLLSIIQFAYE